MSKRILVINGNPNPESFCGGLTDAYREGAEKAGAEVKTLMLGELDFNVNLPKGFKDMPELEPSLKQATEDILWSEHMVWIHPLWWYGYPAIMKGFIDRIFLPGVTFKFVGRPFPEMLLKGRTARIITTADTPHFYYRWFMGSPALKQLKKGTLEFCGVSPVRSSFIAPLKKSTESFRETWLQKIYRLGQAMR